MKSEYPPRAPSSSSSRYVKAPQLGGGRRGNHIGLGGQNSRAYIERGDYLKSSAMSDTSEAPSLGELKEEPNV